MNKYKKNIFVTMLFIISAATICHAAEGQTFDIKDASEYFDIKISTAECDQDACRGKAEFSFFRKGETAAPYQVINFDETYILLRSGGILNSTTLLYDKQEGIRINDFNFDGMEDVAISNGAKGNYGSTSYSVYLSSKSAGKFVYNKDFSDLGENYFGMFGVDNKTKTLETMGKNGCCFYIIEKWRVVKNKPVKFSIETTDATGSDGRQKIISEKIINGKWKKSVRYEKRKE